MSDKFTDEQLLDHFNNDMVDMHAPFEQLGRGLVQRCDMCAEIRRRLAPRKVSREWVKAFQVVHGPRGDWMDTLRKIGINIEVEEEKT